MADINIERKSPTRAVLWIVAVIATIVLLWMFLAA